MHGTADIRNRYDEVAASYGLETDDVNRRLYWLAYERLTWSGIERVLPPDERSIRILDAGGGGGKYGALLAGRGHEVTVADLSPKMLDAARQRFESAGLAGRGRFVEANILELPFEGGSFDFVLSEGDPVSYCVGAHGRAIAELVRVVARGGPVLMGVDNRQEYFLGALRGADPAQAMSILLQGTATCPYGLPVHTFTIAELTGAIEAADADLIEISGKPVLFFELLAALAAERGPRFDAWENRDEVLALQERLAREGYASAGGHLQVIARRR